MRFRSIVNFSNPAESNGIRIPAPASGKVSPLEQLPHQYAGQGIAIKLEGHDILSPVSGKVVELLPAHGKIVLQSKNRLRFLLELPVEYTEFHGTGIKVLVSIGQVVKARTPLLQIDLYKIQQHIKQVHLRFLLLDYSAFKSIDVPHKRVTAGEDTAFSLVPIKK